MVDKRVEIFIQLLIDEIVVFEQKQYVDDELDEIRVVLDALDEADDEVLIQVVPQIDEPVLLDSDVIDDVDNNIIRDDDEVLLLGDDIDFLIVVHIMEVREIDDYLI